jgi:DNA-directed RNA polymerase subunit RPC12/RpoP
MSEELEKVRDVPGKRNCGECGEEYNIVEQGLQMPGTKDWELINCPYCGHSVLGWTNGIWHTNKISKD